MSVDQAPDHREFMRLKDEFRSSFDWKGAAFTRDGFVRWARNKSEFPIRIDPHKWRPFRDGEPVLREMVEAFSEYISEVLELGRFTLRAIATPCGPPPIAQDKEPRNIWKVGWIGTLAFFARNLTVPEDAYCRDERDLREAARMVLRGFGEGNNRFLDGEAAIAFAEDAMGRTLDEYTELLLRFWKANENTVLFATLSERGAIRRAGVCVSAPITREFYGRYRGGDMEDMDITPDDLLPESRFIHIAAVADNKEADIRRAKAARSVAMTRTVCFQIAALSPPLHKADAELQLISVAGCPENRGRLKSYNFQEVGAVTRVTRMPVAEFAPPGAADLGAAYPLALAEYLAMKAVVIVFQAAIRTQRLADDD